MDHTEEFQPAKEEAAQGYNPLTWGKMSQVAQNSKRFAVAPLRATRVKVM